MSNNEDKFSASASTLGYLYQCRYALFEGLRKIRKTEDFFVSIETLDDVVFSKDFGAVDLLQTKHSIRNTCNLTDASTELWKTLRIWAERLLAGNLPEGSSCYLITTAQSANGSAAFYLKVGNDRNIEKAFERLNATVDSSTNKDNKKAYEVYKQLSTEEKLALLNIIHIVDASPEIKSIETEIRSVIYYATQSDFLEQFLQRLEGWWYGRIIKHLTDANRDLILDKEIIAEIDRLREQFKEDNLPIDDDLMSANIDASGYQNKAFVHQLQLIEIGNKRIFHAIVNYFRAVEHRSRWLREDLLFVGELERYENKLIEEWELNFEIKRDELGQSPTEEEKKKAAQALYKWVETNNHRPIRNNVTEPAIGRGSYQMLSEEQKVGWHVEFKERLSELLELEGSIL